jgi:prepilin-type N-terminal cleavage/methylation domain-containing protein
MRSTSALLRKEDDGFSLVEILIATVVFGLAAVSLLGALFSLVRSSSLHRTQSKANSVLASAAASIVDPVSNPYNTNCGAVSYNPTNGVTLPSGWTAANVSAAVTSRVALDGSNTCTATSLQTVTITVTLPNGAGIWNLDVVKRP